MTICLGADAADITVCASGCEYSSINTAVQNAEPGDTVLVEAGVYVEHVGFPTGFSGITVKSINGPSETIIDYQLSSSQTGGHVVSMGCACGDCGMCPTKLEGFTIKGGWSSSSAGGVQITGGEIKDCIIKDNIGRFGGGIQVLGGEPVKIQTSIIENNQARDGGGIWINNTGTTLITHSEITGNTATREGGGGVTVGVNTNVTTIRNTPITGNTANSALGNGAGGGLRILWETELVNSPIVFNTATGTTGGQGGGIYLSGTGLTLRNSHISGNAVAGGVEEGAGIYCRAPINVVSASLVFNNFPVAAEEIFKVPSTACSVRSTIPTSANKRPSGRKNDPVNTYTGELFLMPVIDINLGGPMPLMFTRYYASGVKLTFLGGRLGSNWLHNFEARLQTDGTAAAVIDEYGRIIEFQDDGGIWMQTGALDRPYELLELGGEFLFVNPDTDLIYVFDSAGNLTRIEDGKGNVHTLTYSLDEFGEADKLMQVSDGLGRVLSFTYSGESLDTVSDGVRSISFGYAGDELTSFTNFRNKTTQYQYDTVNDVPGLLTAEVRPRANAEWTQTYDAEGRVATQANAFMDTWTYSYNDITGTTTVVNPESNGSSHLHSGTGELLTSTNELGDTSNHGYSGSGRRTTTVTENNETTSTTYDPASGKTASVTWPDGKTMTSTYSPRVTNGTTFHDLSLQTFPDLTTQSFGYDANGNVTLFTDRAGHQTSFTHNANGQILTKTNPRLGFTSYNYNADGTRSTVQDAATNITSYAYDALRRVSTVTRADTTTLAYSYDDNDNLLSLKNENDETTSYTYDDNDNIVTITTPLLEDSSLTYDAMDRLTAIQDPLLRSRTYAYDALGRLTSITNRNSIPTLFTYDAVGRLLDTIRPGGAIWTKGYDQEGSLTSITDPLNKTTTFGYDSMSRVSSITTPLNHTTSYSYDAMGRVSQVTDPMMGTTTFSYDARGDLAETSLPGGIVAHYDRGPLGLVTEVTDPNGNEWLRNYDSMGRVVSEIDPLLRETTYDYDARNRVATVTLPDSLGSVTRTYDGTGNVTRQLYSDGTDLSLSYDDNGELIGGDAIALIRDANGNITQSNGLIISRDDGGRITSVEVAPGKVLTYSYNDDDDLTNVSDWAGGSATLNYDLAGRVTSISRSNGVTTTYTYDDENRLLSIAEFGGTIDTSIALSRDALGRVTNAVRNVPLVPDIVSNVTTASSDYDAALQDTALTHDALGRVTDDGQRVLDWDLAGRLKSYAETTGATTFTYDALGNLLSRIQGSTTREYTRNLAFGLPCATVVSDGTSVLRYYVCTPAGELLYSIEDGDNSRRFYHYDERGSTLLLSDDGGNLSDSYAVSPLGEITGSIGLTENPFIFLGRYGVMAEGADGLYRMHRRLYDSAVGRFLSRDPQGDIEDPRMINPYQYALGDPIQNVDPTGEEPEESSHNHLSDSRVMTVVKRSSSVSNAILSKRYTDKISEYTAELDSVNSVNRLKAIWGNPAEKTARAAKLTKLTKSARKFTKNLGRGARTIKYGALAIETLEKGPQAAIEEGVEVAAEKLIGDKAGKVVGVAIEGFKTNDAVEAERRDMARNQDSSVIAHERIMRHISHMYCRGEISYAKAHLLHKKAQRDLQRNMDGNTEAGYAAIWQRLAEGFNKMLGKAYGVDW